MSSILSRATALAGQPRSRAEGPLLFFSKPDFAIVSLIAEAILPETSTPGALSAGVPQFIDTALNENDPDPQGFFSAGLHRLNDESRSLFQLSFAEASREQRAQLLNKLDARIVQLTRGLTLVEQPTGEVFPQRMLDFPAIHPDEQVVLGFWQVIKWLTLTGYCTSDEGRRALGITHQDFFHSDYVGCTHPEHGYLGP